MLPIKSFVTALALVFSTVAIAAPVASAQGTTVVIIDQGRIMRDSLAGKDIQTKIAGVESAMERELKPTADSLNAEGQTIEAKTANMTPEAMRADAALKTQVTNYALKAQEFNVKRQVASQELQLTERKAWTDFYGALRPVLQEVVAEKGAQVILDRSDAIYADPAIDATDLVISKLNGKTPTINVVRQKLPAQPAN